MFEFGNTLINKKEYEQEYEFYEYSGSIAPWRLSYYQTGLYSLVKDVKDEARLRKGIKTLKWPPAGLQTTSGGDGKENRKPAVAR